MYSNKEDFLNEFAEEVSNKGIGGLVGLCPKEGESKEEFRTRCIEVVEGSFWYSEMGCLIDLENLPVDKF